MNASFKSTFHQAAPRLSSPRPPHRNRHHAEETEEKNESVRSLEPHDLHIRRHQNVKSLFIPADLDALRVIVRFHPLIALQKTPTPAVCLKRRKNRIGCFAWPHLTNPAALGRDHLDRDSCAHPHLFPFCFSRWIVIVSTTSLWHATCLVDDQLDRPESGFSLINRQT
jgi:hypothetical protein